MFDERPDWDTWFMTLAFIVSQRSLDKTTKHGCVVVDTSHTILSVGYNGPPRGCIDENVPLDRPAKYLFMEHAESNAITNAARSGISLRGSFFYITGPPCHDCFRKIVNVGAVKIIQGPILHQRTKEQQAAIEIMNIREGHKRAIYIEQYVDIAPLFKLLTDTATYMARKLKKQEENEKKDSANSDGQPSPENSGG